MKLLVSRPPDHCHCMDKTIYRSLVGNEYERLRGRERNLDKMGKRLEMEPGNDIHLLKIR